MIRSARLETIVGSFLLLGMGIICGISLNLTVLFKPTYNLNVNFQDASGLLRGADVDFRGALIGKVSSYPYLDPETQTVTVKLKIDHSAKIRQGAQFTIVSSGLFGDKFVEVRSSGEQLAGLPPYLQDDQVVKGGRAPDFSNLMAESMPLIQRANHVATQVDDMITLLNTSVLDESGTRNLKAIVLKLREVGDESRSLTDNAKGLIRQVKSGNGALGKLFYDEQVRSNIAGFVANFKSHGALFYSDDTAAPQRKLQSRPPWRARP